MRDKRLLCSFWGFGLLNNLLYVVILSAAIDLVGSTTPKGYVLLADVLPSFIFKATAPFYFHVVPYPIRMTLLVLLSFAGMQLTAGGSSLTSKLSGVAMASLSSGIGEVTFLQLTHYFNSSAINAWSSGTGGAGLVGSFVFMAMTSWMSISTRATLQFFSFMPFFLGVLYKFVLPKANTTYSEQQVVPMLPLSSDDSVQTSGSRTSSPQLSAIVSNFERIRKLLVPFILPLMAVYIAEYVINQGISPTLLYDLLDMPMFRHYRDAYVMYGTLYQIGVFISRSSGSFIRVRNLWLTALLQTINVLLAVLQSLYMFIPSIYLLFAFMLYEGLLGGAAYVNTFMLVSETVPKSEREFAMGAVSMSDSSGVVMAAMISVWLEKSLCHYQVNQGRPWCELT